jgi:hypothetical protein
MIHVAMSLSKLICVIIITIMGLIDGYNYAEWAQKHHQNIVSNGKNEVIQVQQVQQMPLVKTKLLYGK